MSSTSYAPGHIYAKGLKIYMLVEVGKVLLTDKTVFGIVDLLTGKYHSFERDFSIKENLEYLELTYKAESLAKFLYGPKDD